MPSLNLSFRFVPILLVCLSSSGCIKTWKSSPVGPRSTIEQRPDRIRVVLHDGSDLVLHGPTTDGEEIHAVTPSSRICVARPDGTPSNACRVEAGTEVTVPFSDVSHVELRKSSGWNIALYTLVPLIIIIPQLDGLGGLGFGM
ncbi:MAG: hypothetical protein ACPHO4_12950 [Longimicrobiales bacterium]